MLQYLPALLLCPLAVSAQMQTNWPNLIIPISSADPDHAFGTEYWGHAAVNPDGSQIGTEIVFDNIPINTGASYCSVEFELANSGPFTLNGDAQIGIYQAYGDFISQTDTWNSHPAFGEQEVGRIVIQDGQVSVWYGVVECNVAKAQFALLPIPGAQPFDFTWFELNDSANKLFNGITFKQWS